MMHEENFEEPTRSNSPVSRTRKSFACRLSGHVGNLVEKQCAAVRQLKPAHAIGLRICERAAHMAK